MSSSNPLSSPTNSIKKSSSSSYKPPVSSPPEVKKVFRPDGSSRPVTSSSKTVPSYAVRTTTSATRPDQKSKLLGQVKDEQGPRGKPTMGTSSAPRPEKTKQPVQGIKKEEPGSKGKEVVRSQVIKSPISISNSRPVNAVAKSEVKNKAPASTLKTDTKSTKTIKKTGTRGKTEKKVYTLHGQKHDPPEEREPLRIFYESLSKQIPTSEMAEFWMMEHGLLSSEKAKKAYEKKQKKQHQFRTGTPVKSVVKFEKPESSRKVQSTNNGDMKAKKRVNYSDDDDDFIVRTKKFKV